MRRGFVFVLLSLWALGGVAVVFLPIGTQLNDVLTWMWRTGREAGIPGFITLNTYDFVLNVVLFAVPSALAATSWPRVPRWVWVAGAAVASTLIETIQFLALPRTASVWDVVSNTLGALVGLLVLRRLERRAPAQREVLDTSAGAQPRRRDPAVADRAGERA